MSSKITSMDQRFGRHFVREFLRESTTMGLLLKARVLKRTGTEQLSSATLAQAKKRAQLSYLMICLS